MLEGIPGFCGRWNRLGGRPTGARGGEDPNGGERMTRLVVLTLALSLLTSCIVLGVSAALYLVARWAGLEPAQAWRAVCIGLACGLSTQIVLTCPLGRS